MKKILFGTFAVFTAAAACTVQAIAAAPSVTVKSDKSDVEYTYTSVEGSQTASADAAKLFGGLADASAENYTSELLTVTSSSAGEVEVALNFSYEEGADGTVLDYYDFKIADENGELIYSSEDADPSDAELSEKKIVLGVFNTESDTEEKTYQVEYKVNSSLADADFSKLKAELTASAENSEFEVKAAAQALELPAAENAEIETAVAAAATEEPAEQSIEFMKTCGLDITAGRYVVTGRGVVKITGADGTKKSETTVTDKADAADGAVDSFIASIVDGDIITVVALDGDSKPSIKFAKTNTSAAAAPSSAVAAAETDTAAATETPAPSQAPASEKTNPKTGENDAISILGALMLAAGAGIAGLEIVKRRRASDK